MLAYDYLAVFKNKQTGEFSVFHNDSDGILEMLETPDSIFATFNGKHYDRFILSAIVENGDTATVKEVNDWIISGNAGWEYPNRATVGYFFPMYDLMDDCQKGLSLKAIEAHLGMDIRESTIPFDIDRPLTESELDELIFYCKHDVDATDKLDDLRQGYLKNKIHLGNEAGIPPERALYMTNAKLTAMYLNARPPAEPYTDEREYKFPANLKLEYIPQQVIEFFSTLADKGIPDDVVFSSKMNVEIGGCTCVIGYGGIHGAIPCYKEDGTDKRIIRNFDVSSYYPHLMVLCGYTSRNIPSPETYAAMLERRIAAKKSGDKATANALKLVANTTYGATLNQYNDLYDPLQARSVCISGQLFLMELLFHLVRDIPGLRPINVNTDGIMISFDDSYYSDVLAITQEWETRTGFELEEDKIKTIIQKDVNNYIEIPLEGKPKIKGGVLVRGIAGAGAFNINNNAPVVADAVVKKLVDDIPVDNTIFRCERILDFQLVSKASHKYSHCFHMINGEMVEVQKTNRVYATTDYRYGTLYKQHGETGSIGKIPGLPAQCFVDNDNTLTSFESIDRDWYCRLAKQYVDDFIGAEPIKRDTREVNKRKRTILNLLKGN